MSDILKCPYCGGILEQTSIYNINAYACTDLACKGYFMTATKDMWQELIRTHKALEIAKERLKNTILDAEILATPEYLASRAKETLDEITVLEQKD